MNLDDDVDRIVGEEVRHLLERHSEWSTRTGTRDLELTAHALRVLLQLDRVLQDTRAFLALADVQRPDGGWNSTLDDEPGGAWVSAFAALTGARARRVLGDARLNRAVSRAVDFLLSRQASDGSWTNRPTWTTLDATKPGVDRTAAASTWSGCRIGAGDARPAAGRPLFAPSLWG